MITRPQVEHFLTAQIGFHDWESVLGENKEEFLFKLVHYAQKTLYYENITWGSLPPEERKIPTREDSVTLILDTLAGSCIQLNNIIKVVLEKLGFETFLVGGEIPCAAVANNHALTIVKLKNNAGTKKIYLVDIGMARPTAGPVNLCNLPQRTIEAGYEVEFRFNVEKNWYERILLNGCPLKGPMEPEYLDFFFELVPFDFPDFQKMLTDIFTDPTTCFFLNVLFLFRFTRLESWTDYDYVAFRGKRMVKGTAETRSEVKYATYIEMFPVVMELFPRLDQNKLRAALHYYDSRVGAKW